MAFKHGKLTTVTVNSQALTGFGTNADFNIDVDTAETTTFGSAWKSFLAGVPGAKLDLAGDFDPTVTTGPAAVLEAAIVAAVAVPVVYQPAGAGTGNRQHSFSAIITSYGESSPVGGIVTFKASLLGTGAVTTTTL